MFFCTMMQPAKVTHTYTRARSRTQQILEKFVLRDRCRRANSITVNQLSILLRLEMKIRSSSVVD